MFKLIIFRHIKAFKKKEEKKKKTLVIFPIAVTPFIFN